MAAFAVFKMITSRVNTRKYVMGPEHLKLRRIKIAFLGLRTIQVSPTCIRLPRFTRRQLARTACYPVRNRRTRRQGKSTFLLHKPDNEVNGQCKNDASQCTCKDIHHMHCRRSFWGGSGAKTPMFLCWTFYQWTRATMGADTSDPFHGFHDE